MNKERIIEELEDILGCSFDENAKLEDFEDWDSIAKVSVIAFFDEAMGIKIKMKDFKEKYLTVKDLLDLANL